MTSATLERTGSLAREVPHKDIAVQEQMIALAVENMHCGGCMRAVEKALGQCAGVHHVRANLSAKRVQVRFDPNVSSEEALIGALEQAGFHAACLDDAAALQEEARRDTDYLRRVAVAGFAAANIMLLSVAVWSGTQDMDAATQALFHWLSALIALPAVAYAGQPFFASALQALKGRRLNMDVPISLAVILATGMSLFQTVQGSQQVYFDAAVTLLFFLLIGRWLDQRMRLRARGEAQNLLSLQSGMATLVNDRGEQRNVPAHALAPGDTVQVATGMRVPADGEVISGEGRIDNSLITGESEPVRVAVGDPVYAGTLNLSAPLLFRVTAADDMTLLAEIGRLMADAEQGRARYRRLADRAARIYAPAVHLLGAVTFLGWLLLGAGWESALTYAIAVLIITCPCALALAVPAVQIAAASRLFREGVLLKAPDALERLAEADTAVFDKTGTLTLGRPVLLDADAIPGPLLKSAARLAAASAHPYARAVAEAARERFGRVQAAARVSETPGEGMARITKAGEERLGSARWCNVPEGEAAGASLFYRAADGTLAAFECRDALRGDAADTVQTLAGMGLAVALLWGDGEEAVRKAAEGAGV
ncbi:MAG: heavy metal translocating P-type ATPase, partial [Alphaproteobacteria bacterium]